MLIINAYNILIVDEVLDALRCSDKSARLTIIIIIIIVKNTVTTDDYITCTYLFA